MYKDVIRSLDLGMLPQIGLLAFVLAFAAILIYAFTLSRAKVSELSDLPFDDAAPLPPAEAPPVERP